MDRQKGLLAALLVSECQYLSANSSHTSNYWSKETAVVPLPPGCTEALSVPIPPPPSVKRGLRLLQVFSLNQNVSLQLLNEISTYAAYYGLFVVFTGLTIRSVLYLRSGESGRSSRGGHSAERPSTSPPSTFEETNAHVPLLVARSVAFTSAIASGNFSSTHLRKRIKSRQVTPHLQQEDAWEPTGHVSSDEDDKEWDADEPEDQVLPIVNSDTENNNGDNADLLIPPIDVVSPDEQKSRQSQDDGSEDRVGLLLTPVAKDQVSDVKTAGESWLDLENADQAPAEKLEEGFDFPKIDDAVDARSTPGGGVGGFAGIPRPRPSRTLHSGRHSPTQTQLLSRAWAKADAAVRFDNSSLLKNAVEAYAEAIDLLDQVMVCSSDEADQTKVSAVRKTYSDRMVEILPSPIDPKLRKTVEASLSRRMPPIPAISRPPGRQG
jgi:hypothetical protein